MYYIGVDLGTSAVKLLLMEARRYTSEMWFQRNIRLYFPHPGWSEQNAGGLVDRCAWTVSQELVPEETREKVAGISFGGQMHGLVVLDEKDRGDPSGDPLE